MKSIQINQLKIPFELKKSPRAKRLTLKIEPREAKFVLIVPRFTFKYEINRFLEEHSQWIETRWLDLKNQLARRPELNHSLDYYKAKAKVTIRERLVFFNSHYQFDYNRVSFRDQKTRWGSCSSARNLSFNWRLILAPKKILDYIVVHELCHLKEMNHSEAFWKLVAKQIPDYKERKRWLRENQYLLSVGI